MSLMMSTGPIAQQSIDKKYWIEISPTNITFQKEGGTQIANVVSDYAGLFSSDVEYISGGSDWLNAVNSDGIFAETNFNGPDFPVYVKTDEWFFGGGQIRTAIVKIYVVEDSTQFVTINVTQIG